MEINVSDKLDDNSSDIKDALSDIIEDLASCKVSVIEMIKEMTSDQVATVLEKQYLKKKPEELSGDKGRAAMIQTALSHLGHNDLVIDGIYGPITQQKVSQFQLKNKLNGEGRAGSKTITLLIQRLREMDGGVCPTPAPIDYNNSKVAIYDATEKKMKVSYTSKLDDFKLSNDLIKYRANEKIPTGTFTGSSVNLNGKGIGEVLVAIHEKEGAGSGAIKAKLMEVLYQYDLGRDPLLYAYSLWDAMQGFGTSENMVSSAMSRGNNFKILDNIFDSFGTQNKKNLVQFIASDFKQSVERRSSVSIYFKHLAIAGEKPKEAVKDLLLSGGYLVSSEMRKDQQFAASLGIVYTDIGGRQEQKKTERTT